LRIDERFATTISGVRGAEAGQGGRNNVLINCVAYQDGRKLGDIPVSDIHSYVSRPDCFVWVAIKDPEPAELAAMQSEFSLHPLAVEDAQHGHQRPKIEEYGQSLFVVLHMIENGREELTVGEVAIFAGDNYVLSVRSRAERGFTDVRRRCEAEPELLRHGSGYVLYALMDAVVDRYFPVLDAIETELEAVEGRIFANQTERASLETLYGIKQKLMTMKHATEPLLEATGRLYGGRVPPLCMGLQDYFRDIADHLVRLNQSTDSLRDMVTTAISVSLSLITLQENEVTKRLAAYGALVAVPTMVAGVYGMNFQYMPELQWTHGYPVALALMALIDVYLFYRFRKANWL
jgi:magnesium transporter